MNLMRMIQKPGTNKLAALTELNSNSNDVDVDSSHCTLYKLRSKRCHGDEHVMIKRHVTSLLAADTEHYIISYDVGIDSNNT